MGDKTPEKDKSGVDKSSITFKSSSNFKNMKKFFKHIYEREEAKNGHNVNMSMEVEEIERKPVLNHPPLPDLNNGFTTQLITSPKKEIIDPEEDKEEETQTTVIKTEPVEIKLSSEEPKKQTDICRDFLKNNCVRPNCIYRHENDKEARLTAYTFCKDYQNKICKHKNCKFVHASIFEQERYYDTGVLPPEALSHLKNNDTNTSSSYHKAPTVIVEPERPFVVPINIRKTPPPPPPEIGTLPLNPKTVALRNLSMVPPPKQNGIEGVPQFPNINTIPAILTSPENVTMNGTKRPWSDSHEFLLSPRGQVAVAKRTICEQCPLMEERYKQCTSKILSLNKGVEDHIGKISSVDKMHARLYGLQIAMITIMGEGNSGRESPRLSLPVDNGDKMGVDIRSALQVLVNRLSAEELIKSWNGAVRSG